MTSKDGVRIALDNNFIQINKNIPNLNILLRPGKNGLMEICFILDNTGQFHLGPGDIMVIYNFITDQYFNRGFTKFDVHCFIFSDNIERDRLYNQFPLNFWIIDVPEKNIIIYEDQPDDPFNMKEDFDREINKSLPSFMNKHLPYITILLVSINVIVFLLCEFIGSTQDTSFMLSIGASNWDYIFNEHEYYRLFTSMFLHFDGEHLINNMIILSILGYEVEYLLGHFRYFFIYILSGLGSGLISALYYMNTYKNIMIVSAGASGAIFGILGSLLIISLIDKDVRRKLRPTNLVFIIVLSILNGLSSESIDNMAHIGGLMFGIILTFISCVCYKCIIKYKNQ